MRESAAMLLFVLGFIGLFALMIADSTGEPLSDGLFALGAFCSAFLFFLPMFALDEDNK